MVMSSVSTEGGDRNIILNQNRPLWQQVDVLLGAPSCFWPGRCHYLDKPGHSLNKIILQVRLCADRKQIIPICAAQMVELWNGNQRRIGGSRATVATSGRYAARLAFSGMSEPIAESARVTITYYAARPRDQNLQFWLICAGAFNGHFEMRLVHGIEGHGLSATMRPWSGGFGRYTGVGAVAAQRLRRTSLYTPSSSLLHRRRRARYGWNLSEPVQVGIYSVLEVSHWNSGGQLSGSRIRLGQRFLWRVS